MFLETKKNIEQGTRNVQYRSIGVRELNRRCSLINSTVKIRYSFQLSIFIIPCSMFVIPLDFDIQNSLFNIHYSLFLILKIYKMHYSIFEGISRENRFLKIRVE